MTSDIHPLLDGIGERLRERRKALKLSLRDLAEVAGTDAARVSRLERGQRVGNLSINVVAGLAHALGCRFGWLTTGELPIEPAPAKQFRGSVIVIQDGGDVAEQVRELERLTASLKRGEAPVAQLPAATGNENDSLAVVGNKARRRRR